MQRADKPNDMQAQIRAVDNEHKGRYGDRRIGAAVCHGLALPVNHKRVQRLMQQMGLRSLIRAENRDRHTHELCDVNVPHILQRDCQATAFHVKWVTGGSLGRRAKAVRWLSLKHNGPRRTGRIGNDETQKRCAATSAVRGCPAGYFFA
ncbi:MAG: integrase core domain protein [Rhodoferax sp.]|nr:integrase core domain protein [Rhodoferax sp.]